MPPEPATWITGPERSVFGAVGGSGKITASVTPACTGVAGPYAGVKSAIPFAFGSALSAFSARRWPVPRQVPKNSIRRTSRPPSAVMPTLERSPYGGLSTTPSRIRMPLGRPVDQLNMSPLTPTIVACVESRLCIALTRSVPGMSSFESTGLSAKRPVGRGAVTTCSATGPFGVNWTARSYVTPGRSVCLDCAAAGATSASASAQAMRGFRSTTPLEASASSRGLCRDLRNPNPMPRHVPASR